MQKRYWPLFLALLPLSATGQHGSADQRITVFGISLLEPLSMKECEFREREKPRHLRTFRGEKELTYVLTSPKGAPCYERSLVGSSEQMHEESVSIKFPVGQEPNLSKYESVVVRIIRGRVERLWFWTRGVSFQQRDLSALNAKFGEPNAIQTRSAQNRFGASFDTVVATWNLVDQLTVLFTSTDGSIDRGQVVISTPSGEESFAAAIQAITNKGTEL